MKLPIYELRLGDKELTGIQRVSLVNKPAMQVSAVKLEEDLKPVLLAKNEYKQYLTSAVIIPEKLIYRNDAENGEYFIKFVTDGIDNIRDSFIKNGELHLSNKNHIQSDVVNAQLVEIWTITDVVNDKAVALGFKGLPVGTLMATYKINDDKFWKDEVLTGNVTGFSLEGLFSQLLVNAQVNDHIESKHDEWSELEAALSDLAKMLG